MKILLTGANGFIGSHLGNKLVELGHDVQGIDNNFKPSGNKLNFDCVTDDFQNLKSLEGYDAVFHLAAYINVDESIEKPLEYFDNNARGTAYLLQCLYQTNPKCKFIYASSCEVYGTARTPLMNENHPIDPLSPYAVSKLAAEQMCKIYSQIHNLDITVIRNFNTFGEYQHGGLYGGVVAKFTKLAKEGKDLPIYGSGEQTRDLMYISQAVDGYILALNTKLPLIINFGSGTSYKIIDIANYIADKFGVKVYHAKPRPNEIMKMEADVTRAKDCGYKVMTEFWKDLDRYIDFIKG